MSANPWLAKREYDNVCSDSCRNIHTRVNTNYTCIQIIKFVSFHVGSKFIGNALVYIGTFNVSMHTGAFPVNWGGYVRSSEILPKRASPESGLEG